MGRRKIEMKKIENLSNRQITFSKRRGGLLKKASDLAILCDAQVGVIIFSSTGRLYEFSSSGSSMQNILARYTAQLNLQNPPARAQVPQLTQNGEQPQPEAKQLEQKLGEMQILLSRMLGRALDGLTLPGLEQLEQYIMGGLVAVKNRKEQALIQMVNHSKLLEYKAIEENKSLHKQVEDLRRSSQESLLLGFTPTQSMSLPLGMEADVSSQRLSDNNGDEREDSDICLDLGPSSRIDDVISRPSSESFFVNFIPARSESLPPRMEADCCAPDENVVNDKLSSGVVLCKGEMGRVETVVSGSSGSQSGPEY